ncbi:MAG: helix-turn-helix domain-containing protein [Clostridia bacterium]|nr:helix-turn-helix domain-containing protein [Clostridia bacterium]
MKKIQQEALYTPFLYDQRTSRSMAAAHYHNWYEIYYLVKGTRRYFIETDVYDLEEGDLVLVPEKVAHQTLHQPETDPTENHIRYLFSPKKEDIPTAFLPLFEKHHFRPSPAIRQQIHQCFEDLRQYLETHGVYQQHFYQSTLIKILCLLAETEPHQPSKPHSRTDTIMQQAAEYIKEHCAEPLSLADVAERYSYTKEYFSTVFKRSTGMGFNEYLNQMRVSKAAYLLKTGQRSVVNIALEVGFNDPNYFATVFKKCTGMTPQTFRAEKRTYAFQKWKKMENNLNNSINRLQMLENRWKPIPFWSWNGELKPDRLRKQIEWMRQTNNGGFFMHARAGLRTEYLSKEWMDSVALCADAAGSDMSAWVYDENGWPSGFVGGKLLENEANHDQYLMHTIGEFDPNAAVSYCIDGDVLRRVNEPVDGATHLNITIHIAAATTDILNPNVTNQFLQLTHESYKERFGDDFARKIAGFFTDEPQYQRWHTAYTPMVAKYFRDHYDEDIFDKIGLLFVEQDGYRDFRYRYWKAMQSLMLSNFSKKVYDWCDNNGVKLTGHYVEEQALGRQIMCCAGVMPFYEYEHIPGIDWLGSSTNNELSCRQVGSAAMQLGKKQILVEAFASCGWDITPRSLRRVFGFQAVTGGVNLLCQHLLPYEEYGQRKRDFPAHYSPVNPWVNEQFDEFNLYIGRLSKLVGESKEPVRVALLHPIRGAYFDYKREGGNIPDYTYTADCGVKAATDQLLRDCRLFSASGIAFHFLDETLLERHGFVEGDRIGCGHCTYDYLVLPHIVTMDWSTERHLRQYVKNGGKVLILGDPPSYLEGSPYNYDYLQSNCTFEEIEASMPVHIGGTEHKLYLSYRLHGDAPFLLVQNSSPDECFDQTFRFDDSVQSLMKLDLCTMQTEQVPLSLHIAAGETLVLFPSGQPMSKRREIYETAFRLQDATVRFDANYLPIDKVRYSTDGQNWSHLYPCRGLFHKLLQERYEGDLYLKYEFEMRELPQEIKLLAEEDSTGEQWVNGHPIVFTEQAEIESHMWMTDIAEYVQLGKNDYTVKLNWYQSEQVYYVLFGKGVTEGLKNCLVYDRELEPVILAGHFGVYSDQEYQNDSHDSRYVFGDKFYIGAPPVTVTEPVTDGLPFFRGKLTISQDVSWTEDVTHLRFNGTFQSAYIRINGQDAGTLLFDRSVNIRPYKQPGLNRVEIDFIISNRNLLGPHHNNTVLARHAVSPATWELGATWDDNRNPFYRENYEFLKLHCF